jgi:hypothetical protein
VIRYAMLALVALAVAIPNAAADPLAIEGPPSPQLLPDHDDVVHIHLKETDGGTGAEAGAGGTTMMMQAGCTQDAAIQRSNCFGNVCLDHQGYGSLPVYIAPLSGQTIGAGVDSGLLPISAPLALPTSGGDPEPSPSPQGQDEGRYGPYNGVFVNKEGHCGA